MRTLYQTYETLLQNTTTGFKRYLYNEIKWDNRMIGIIGARGVGKTTMILQYIKENLDHKKALYVSADDMYFSENRLVDLADEFYKSAGEYLFIDEIHKYANWRSICMHFNARKPDPPFVFSLKHWFYPLMQGQNPAYSVLPVNNNHFIHV